MIVKKIVAYPMLKEGRMSAHARFLTTVVIAVFVGVIIAGLGAEPVCPPDSLRPVLASPRWESDGFHFRLEGASNATYLIEVSTNLSDWTVFSTNAGGTSLSLQPAYPQAYVRAVLEDPVYPLFNFAVRAGVGMEVSGIIVDSYDSSDPRYSTNGEYDPAKAKDGGDLAIGWGDLGNSKIKGKVFTASNSIVTFGPNAQIGSTGWHLAGSTGAEPGWITNNLRPTFMPGQVKVPFTSAAPPPRGVGELSTYQYVLGSGNYRTDMISGDVLVLGNARLMVTRLIRARHILVLTNASLQIFSFAIEAAFESVTNLADVTAFQYYGFASNISISFSPDPYSSSGLLLKGLIYAPNAICVIPSGGGVRPHLYGACIVRYLRAHDLRIHFDEALKRFCPP